MAMTDERNLNPRVHLLTVADMVRNGHGCARTVWSKVKRGELPKPLSYGGKAVWRESSIIALLDKLERKAKA